MLSALQRASGLDAVYLTRLAGPADDRIQEVVLVSADAAFGLAPGTLVPWDGSPCRVMLDGGPRTRDLRADHPDHPLRDSGATMHLSVPVRDLDGEIWGTLCGSDAGSVEVGPSLVVLFELFSTLITQHLFGAAPSGTGDADHDDAEARAHHERVFSLA
jgi:diguanylate cyclase